MHKNSKAWWATDCWNYSPDYIITIIVNDKFVEFRKALVEGKTIQYRNINVNGFENWRDLNGLSFNSNFEHRIKPEEPLFKEGEWCWRLTAGCYSLMRYPGNNFPTNNLEPFIGELPTHLKN